MPVDTLHISTSNPSGTDVNTVSPKQRRKRRTKAEQLRGEQDRIKFFLLFRTLESEFLPRTVRERFLTIEIAIGCLMGSFSDSQPLPSGPGVLNLEEYCGPLPSKTTGRRRWSTILSGNTKSGSSIAIRMTPVIRELVEELRKEMRRPRAKVASWELLPLGERATRDTVNALFISASRDFWRRCDLLGDESWRPA
jgi:hypothetical protein